jgi:hypothetical protein
VEAVSIQRFEVDFYATDTADFGRDIRALAESYPAFFPVFVEGVLGIAADYRDFDSYEHLLYEFRTHRSMLGLKDTIVKHYPDLSSYNPRFTESLVKYLEHFPGSEQPEVVTFVSEFGNKAILYEGGIGISLDMFLGPQYPFYDGMGLPRFIIEHLTAEQILPNAMRVLAEDHARIPGAESTMLDFIVYEGKKLYFAEQLLKKVEPHRIIEYSKEEYDWCLDNEVNIWNHLVESDVLFSRKYNDFNRYIDPSPTTYGMPAESPGRIGIWVGWQIVRFYMDKKGGTSLKKLMEDLDARTILEDSGYRPR